MLAKLQGLQDAKKPLEIKQNEINEIKNRVKKELNDVKNEISFLEDKKYDLIKNRAELSKKISACEKMQTEFKQKILHLGNANDTQLRLKGQNIKSMEYRGWNPFKRCSAQPEYAKQAAALRTTYDLREDAQTTATAILTELKSQETVARNELSIAKSEIQVNDNNLERLNADEQRLNGKDIRLLNKKIPDWRSTEHTLRQANIEIAEVADKLDAKLDAPVDMKSFCDVWSSNSGCKSIQNSLKNGKNPRFNESEVIRELSRHYDLNTSRNQKIRDEITGAMTTLSERGKLQDQCLKIYQSTLRPVENGTSKPEFRTVYRVAHLGNNSIFGAAIAGKTYNGLVKSNTLLACSETMKAAEEYEQTMEQKRDTLFIIKGCSQISLQQASLGWREEKEWLFSPYALFEVNSVEKKGDRNVVTLTEKLTSMDRQERRNAYELQL